MSRLATAIAAAAMVTALSSSARAQEGTAPDWANKNGAIGIGANTSLGGTNGLSFRTYVSPLFGIQATLGMRLDSTTADAGGNETNFSQTQLDIGLYGNYKLAYWQRGHLSTIFGVDVVSLSNAVESGGVEQDDSATDFLIGLGIMGEYFPTQYLSLFAQVGLRLDFIGDDDLLGDDDVGVDMGAADLSGIDISLGADLLGSAGFTVWFK